MYLKDIIRGGDGMKTRDEIRLTQMTNTAG